MELTKKKGAAEAKAATEVEATKASATAAPHLPAVALVLASAASESAASELVPSTPLVATSPVPVAFPPSTVPAAGLAPTAEAFLPSPVAAAGLAQESAKASITVSYPTSPTSTSVPCLSKRALASIVGSLSSKSSGKIGASAPHMMLPSSHQKIFLNFWMKKREQYLLLFLITMIMIWSRKYTP